MKKQIKNKKMLFVTLLSLVVLLHSCVDTTDPNVKVSTVDSTKKDTIKVVVDSTKVSKDSVIKK